MSSLKESMRENFRYILTLAIICCVTATLLSGVYFFTRPKILKQKEQQHLQALQEVLPEAGYFEEARPHDELIYFKAYASRDKERILGYAFKAEAYGYSSVIETIAGMDTQGRIAGIKILEQKETPGLGAKIAEVLAQKTLAQAIKELFTSRKKPSEMPAQPWFCVQFQGKEVEDLVVVKGPTEKNIQAITGATISSQTLTDSVRQVAEKILEYEKIR